MGKPPTPDPGSADRALAAAASVAGLVLEAVPFPDQVGGECVALPLPANPALPLVTLRGKDGGEGVAEPGSERPE